MMTQPGIEHEAFHSMLEEQYSQIIEADALLKVRSKAWDHFLELGLPNQKTEVFRYLRLKNLFSQQYQLSYATQEDVKAIAPHILPECQESVLVFVNGHYRAELSNISGISKKAVISHLNAATRTYGALLNNHWAKTMKEETDPFAALNAALHRDGVFIYLPPKTVLEAPVQVLNVIDSLDLNMLIMPRIQVFVGASAQLTLATTSAILSGQNFGFNQVVDFAIDENAHVHYSQIAWDLPQHIWSFDATRASLKSNSTFDCVSAHNGSYTLRQDYHAVLTGENAQANLNGVWMLKDKNEAHTHVFMDHQAPYCRSMQNFKGVLRDVSQSSFEGKIMVRQAAQKTEAFQLNKNLLLSDYAQANSKPNLEIFADDVKASHGATVGRLDKEQLFYMRTRGYSHQQAEALLVHGFCQDVLDLITIPSLHKEAVKQTYDYIGAELGL